MGDDAAPHAHACGDLLDAFAAVARGLAGLVASIGDGGGLPTPCVGWSADAVAAAAVTKMQLFADAPRGEAPGHPDLGRPRAVDAAEVEQAAAALLATYTATPPEQSVTLPLGTMPAREALGVALLDALLHAWDLAVAMGERFAPPDTAVALAAAAARRVVTDELRASGAFAPPIPVTTEAPDLAALVALCGRSPSWSRESPR